MHRKPLKDLLLLMLLSLFLLPTSLASSMPISAASNRNYQLGTQDSHYACIKRVPDYIVFVNL